MLQSLDDLPLNFGITGKGNDAEKKPLQEQCAAGVVGLKLHEDWGTTPSAIISCLDIGDKYDVQASGFLFCFELRVDDDDAYQNHRLTFTQTLLMKVALSRVGCLFLAGVIIKLITYAGTIAAFGGRTIHTYHTEGAGQFTFSAGIIMYSPGM